MPGAGANSKPKTPNSEPARSAHAAAQEAYFIRRAKERFGMRVSAARYREFCRRVIEVERDVRFLSRDLQKPWCTHWGVRFGGHLMRVVLDERTERLATCIPIAESGDQRPGTKDHRQKLRRLARRGSRPRRADPSLNSQHSTLISQL